MAEGMWNTLEKMEGREGIDPVRKQRQLEILKNLPEDFDLLVKGFHILKPDDQLHGEIFEYLVRADRDICPNGETKAAQELREVMHNPKRFKLLSISKSITNRDAVLVDGNTIFGAVEAKFRVGIGARHAAKIYGTKPALLDAINLLTNEGVPNLKKHGLPNLANSISDLRISDDFVVTVAMPFDEVDFGFFASKDRYLKKNSPFSKDEVYKMADFIRNIVSNS